MSILGSVGNVVSGAVGGLFKCVKPMVDEVLGQVKQQNDLLGELVEQPLKGIMDEVAQGIWQGKGALAFMEEINQDFTPPAQALRGGLESFSNNISSAVDTMTKADTDAAKLVNELAAEFEKI